MEYPIDNRLEQEYADFCKLHAKPPTYQEWLHLRDKVDHEQRKEHGFPFGALVGKW